MIWTFFCRKIIRKNSKSSYFLLKFLQDRKRSSARNILELEKNLLFRADSTAPRRFLIYFFNGVCSFSFVKWPQESTCSFEGVPGALMAWGDCNGLWEVGEGLLDHFWACHILMPPWHAVHRSFSSWSRHRTEGNMNNLPPSDVDKAKIIIVSR